MQFTINGGQSAELERLIYSALAVRADDMDTDEMGDAFVVAPGMRMIGIVKGWEATPALCALLLSSQDMLIAWRTNEPLRCR